MDPRQGIQVVENMSVVDVAALISREIISMKRAENDAPLGFPLITTKSKCRKCGSKLYMREDRSATVTIYHDQFERLPVTHYTRYCCRKGCSLQQHYGFYTEGDCSEVKYDDDWSNQQCLYHHEKLHSA